MNRYHTLLLCALLTGIPLLSQAKKDYGFTDERPCIIVSDWDFQPYEFVNPEGKPSGYNIEVMELILKRLQIPHKFMMQEWYLATEIFSRKEADLIHALPYEYSDPAFIKTKNYINYYTVKLARKTDTPPLRSIRDLHEGDTLVLKKNDYVPLRIQNELQPRFAIEYLSPKDGLMSVRRGQQKYYVWGEIPLSKKIKDDNAGATILKNALKSPFIQITENAGLNSQALLAQVEAVVRFHTAIAHEDEGTVVPSDLPMVRILVDQSCLAPSFVPGFRECRLVEVDALL